METEQGVSVAGFEFRETMAGSLRVVGKEGDAPISFTIRARSRGLSAFLRRPWVEIEGEVFVEGIAEHRPLRGAIDMGPLVSRRIPYGFAFTGDDGAAYAFTGEKTLVRGALIESFSILPGEIRDARGALVGQALLRFDVRSSALRYLWSFRPAT
jgi:hypothetical protein